MFNLFPFQALLDSFWYPVLWLWPFHTQLERWLTLSGRREQKQKPLYEISPQFWWSYFSSVHPRISVAFIFFKQPVSVLPYCLIQFYVIFSLANYFMGFFGSGEADCRSPKQALHLVDGEGHDLLRQSKDRRARQSIVERCVDSWRCSDAEYFRRVAIAAVQRNRNRNDGECGPVIARLIDWVRLSSERWQFCPLNSLLWINLFLQVFIPLYFVFSLLSLAGLFAVLRLDGSRPGRIGHCPTDCRARDSLRSISQENNGKDPRRLGRLHTGCHGAIGKYADRPCLQSAQEGNSAVRPEHSPNVEFAV